MIADEARQIFEEFCDQHGRPKIAKATQQPDGSWLFVQRDDGPPQGEFLGVVVRAETKKVCELRGALGKVFRNALPLMGLPTSNELILGATAWGRYQTFDGGVAIWDGGVFTLRGDGPGNSARPLLESLVKLPRQTCLVAFFDLRGFTTWTGKNPQSAQGAILAFEESVREGFPTDGQSWLRLFIKGTGDGVMIVSQADWYKDDGQDGYCSTIKPGHAKDFLDACSSTLKAARRNLTGHPLQLGCAIATGELDRVFLFGRLDYIGPAANDAAKLQQHARDEICLTDDFLRLLIRDGHEPADSSPMGWRLRASTP